MITIIAEKPSVALEIARIVGARNRKDGYMEGGGYAVTWALGHLVELGAEGDEDWGAELPFLPEHFLLRVARTRRKDGTVAPDPGYARQLGVIKHLFHHSEYIVNAGDAGREGELIQRYIYAFVGGKAPVRRLWISSLTEEAIREGLRHLAPSSDYDNLFLAGKARSEADWLIGVNATRALTKASGSTSLRSLGRVQTPTLALVCRRFIENRDFTPQPFWTLKAQASLGGKPFMASSSRFDTAEEASGALGKVRAAGFLRVARVERKTSDVPPPLLYDLTTLQREANRRFSLTALETLSLAQSLYEKKAITYPRTGSRYISEDVFRTLPALIGKLARKTPGPPLLEELSRRSVSDARVTDHHAILPTGIRPVDLTKGEQSIYSLIVMRLLEAISPKCEMLHTEITLEAGGTVFSLRGSTVISQGWKAIRGETQTPREDEEGTPVQTDLPLFREGDSCPLESVRCVEGKTKPRPLYTDDSLLEAMEHAGREVQDEELQAALKDCGLGTPATRAAEMETLLRRGYVSREGHSLVPSRVGLAVYEAVKDKSIADVALTAEWERTLALVAEGRYDAKAFDRGIRELAGRMVGELYGDRDALGALADAEVLPGTGCPLCGRPVLLTTRLVRCADPSCGWKIWREIAGRALSERELTDLLGEGRTKELKGFRSKSGKTFQACLALSGDGQVGFEFVDHGRGPDGNVLRCPSCGEPVKVYSSVVVCSDESCGWKMWRLVSGKRIADNIIPILLEGGTTPILRGFTSKSGKRFDASLRLDESKQPEFVFQKTIKKKKTW